jgi:hypothetical protein
MLKRVYALVIGTIFLITPVSIFFVDAPPGLAAHKKTTNGNYKGKRDKHESGPQKGVIEKKRQSKSWIGRGQAGKKNSRPKK